MTDKIMPFTKPAPSITHERRPIDMSIVDDMTLIIIMVDSITEMRSRVHSIKHLTIKDSDGRTWAMSALMRLVQQYLSYIIIACGRG